MTRTVLPDLFTRSEFSYLLSHIRFLILPAGGIAAAPHWREILMLTCGVTVRQNKRFAPVAFDACLGKLSSRSKHRIFDLQMPFGTLLVEDNTYSSWAMEKLGLAYSAAHGVQVVYLKGYDHGYCQYPEIMAWEQGELIRRHAPGLREKYASYVAKGIIKPEDFDRIMSNNATVGDILSCKSQPGTLDMLAYHQWTRMS